MTSLAIILNYLGIHADKCDLSDYYLPKQNNYYVENIPYGPDPYRAYSGNPRDQSGWYCYAPPLVQTANSYLKTNQLAYEAVDLTGITQAGLEEQLRSGHPVIVWATLGFGRLAQSESVYWYTPEGNKVVPYTTIHCLVLTGYDENTFKIADPLQQITSISKDKFMQVFEKVGSYAMIVGEEAA